MPANARADELPREPLPPLSDIAARGLTGLWQSRAKCPPLPQRWQPFSPPAGARGHILCEQAVLARFGVAGGVRAVWRCWLAAQLSAQKHTQKRRAIAVSCARACARAGWQAWARERRTISRARACRTSCRSSAWSIRGRSARHPHSSCTPWLPPLTHRPGAGRAGEGGPPHVSLAAAA